LVDLDPQGAATEGLGVDIWQLKKTVYDVLIDEVAKTGSYPGWP
jgi:cellulose biosynthesis protein BcsQ